MIPGYFNDDEFACKCGCGLNNLNPELRRRLEKAREEAGVPFTITSACRCAAHNKKVGGVSNSAHLVGQAADIVTLPERRLAIVRALTNNFDRVIINFEKNFTHVDVDSSKPHPILGTY